MKVILLFALMSVVFLCDAFGQLAHDVSVDSLDAPYKAPLGAPMPQHARVRNRGLNTETNVRMVCITRDPQGTVVYRDTQYFDSIASGESINGNYADFTPLSKGPFSICFNTILAGDQDPSNDTACGTIIAFYERDVQALSIAYPKLNDSIAVGSSFRLNASFRNMSVDDLYFSSLRCEIRLMSSGSLVFRGDTAIEAFDANSTISCLFPARSGIYDTKTIPPGNYIASAITRAKGDGDPSNDTAYSTFTIRQEHDIRADSVFSITAHSILGVPIPMKATFTNRGLDEQNIPVRFSIYWEGKLQYSDTQYISLLRRDSSVVVAFEYFTAAHIGEYSLCAEALLPTDKEPTNNIACSSFIETIQHDLSADTFLALPRRISTGLENPCIVRYKNRGSNDESRATASLVIRDSVGVMVYTNSQPIAGLPWRDSIDVHFPPFLPATDGRYYYCATVSQMNDQFITDDTVYAEALSATNNVEVIRIDFPKDGDSLPPSQGFIPVVTYRNPGASEMQNIAAHVEIRGCNDTTLLCRLDRSIAQIPADSVIVTTVFPSSQGTYDTRVLTPGCYQIVAFSDKSTPPDTARATFFISPIQNTLSVTDPKQASLISISPNPTSGAATIYLSQPSNESISIEVFDALGREMLHSDISAGARTIPLDLIRLPIGQYLARVHAGENCETLPLAILR